MSEDDDLNFTDPIVLSTVIHNIAENEQIRYNLAGTVKLTHEDAAMESAGDLADLLTALKAAKVGYRPVYVVDQQGATFAFRDKAQAEQSLLNEAWAGAVHLTILQGLAPAHLQGIALSDWCTQHLTRDPGCEQ